MYAMRIKHELPTRGELRLVLRSFLVAMIVTWAVGAFAILQGADSWLVRVAIYLTAFTVLIPLFLLPYRHHFQERKRRMLQYEAEYLARVAEQQDDDIWVKMLLNGVIESDL